jgi:hypothetical protein
MNTNTTQGTRIAEAFVIEGDLYAGVNGWGEPFETFNAQVGVTTADGRKLVHREFCAVGVVHTDEGDFVAPSRRRARAFADRVAAAGVIDEARWEPMEEPEALEVRLHREFLREEAERHGTQPAGAAAYARMLAR